MMKLMNTQPALRSCQTCGKQDRYCSGYALHLCREVVIEQWKALIDSGKFNKADGTVDEVAALLQAIKIVRGSGGAAQKKAIKQQCYFVQKYDAENKPTVFRTNDDRLSMAYMTQTFEMDYKGVHYHVIVRYCKTCSTFHVIDAFRYADGTFNQLEHVKAAEKKNTSCLKHEATADPYAPVKQKEKAASQVPVTATPVVEGRPATNVVQAPAQVVAHVSVQVPLQVPVQMPLQMPVVAPAQVSAQASLQATVPAPVPVAAPVPVPAPVQVPAPVPVPAPVQVPAQVAVPVVVPVQQVQALRLADADYAKYFGSRMAFRSAGPLPECQQQRISEKADKEKPVYSNKLEYRADNFVHKLRLEDLTPDAKAAMQEKMSDVLPFSKSGFAYVHLNKFDTKREPDFSFAFSHRYMKPGDKDYTQQRVTLGYTVRFADNRVAAVAAFLAKKIFDKKKSAYATKPFDVKHFGGVVKQVYDLAKKTMPPPPTPPPQPLPTTTLPPRPLAKRPLGLRPLAPRPLAQEPLPPPQPVVSEKASGKRKADFPPQQPAKLPHQESLPPPPPVVSEKALGKRKADFPPQQPAQLQRKGGIIELDSDDEGEA